MIIFNILSRQIDKYNYFFIFFLFSFLWSNIINGQQCESNTNSVLVDWNFNVPTTQCNGANANPDPYTPQSPTLSGKEYTYCPTINNGCGQAILGTKGHQNTPFYYSAICLQSFWGYTAASQMILYNFDPTSTIWDPYNPINLYVDYTIPAGTSGCISGFETKIVQAKKNPTYEKFGVAVVRDGQEIYRDEYVLSSSNINGTPASFNWGSGSEFCSDGSKKVTFRIYFGLVHRLVNESKVCHQCGENKTGFDDIKILGGCGGSTPNASIQSSTCSGSTSNNNGTIVLTNFNANDRFSISLGNSYTGSDTYATATNIPANGVLTNTLPNPFSPIFYTVRYFSAAPLCFIDYVLTLNPNTCAEGSCIFPTNFIVTPNTATCNGNSTQNNASIAISSVTNGDKVGISKGSIYNGPVYTNAQSITSGSYTFNNLPNPPTDQAYTIRIFNGADDCFIDQNITLNHTSCICYQGIAEIIDSDSQDPDSDPYNGISTEDDIAFFEVCDENTFVDLDFDLSVTPSLGTTCPATPLIFSAVLSNVGTQDAEDIAVTIDFPSIGNYSIIQSNATLGNYNQLTGWVLPSLPAGQNATLTLEVEYYDTGIVEVCGQVQNVKQLNDPDSSPGNNVSTEDDYDCAVITLSGPQVPVILKNFSPNFVPVNSISTLEINLINNEIFPISLTDQLVDVFPTGLLIANPVNLSTNLSGILASSGGNTVTFPNGLVLHPGDNRVFVDVIATTEGTYCNTINAGDLKTTSCENVSDATACLAVDPSLGVPPVVNKTISPTNICNGESTILTITIENRNNENMILNQDFSDNFPLGMITNGTITGTCPNVSVINSGTTIRIPSGTIIPSGTCTISVPVTANASGEYCNLILANALNVTVGSNLNLGNSNRPEACFNLVGNMCTPLTNLMISPSNVTLLPGSNQTFSISATGTSILTLYNWVTNGVEVQSFSDQGRNIVVYAPNTAGTYTIEVNVDNSLTGCGTCESVATATMIVGNACTISSITATPTACVPATNTYTVSGSITFSNAPATGTLTVSIGAVTETFTAPFTSPQAYTLTGLTAAGGTQTVTAVFSADAACTATQTYTAPTSCAVSSTCDCKEYIYLNEPVANSILKFEVGAGIALIPKTGVNGSGYWYPGSGTSEVFNPHGLATDLNGNIYIGGGLVSGGPFYQRKFNCDGLLSPVSGTTIAATAENTFSIGNILYTNMRTIGGVIIDYSLPSAYNTCTGQYVGSLCLNGAQYHGGTSYSDNLWGMSYNPTTEKVYITRRYNHGTTSGDPNAVSKVWVLSRAQLEAGISGGACYDPLVITGANPVVNPGENFLPNLGLVEVVGVTSDNMGNFYVVVTNFGNPTSYIYKYNASGGFISSTTLGASQALAMGIVWSETTNRLYTSHYTDDPTVNCISAYDANTLSYLGTAAPNPAVSSDDSGKAIAIIKECCPVNLPATFQKEVCGATGTKFYLNQEAFDDCDGIVCGSSWTPVGTLTNMTFDACDNSVTVTGTGCGTFTLNIGAVTSTNCSAQSATFTICNTTPSATVAGALGTCNGANPNNDASINITAVMNANQAGISTGSTYTGPAYGASGTVTISGGNVSFSNLMHNTQYTVRIFNSSNDCFENYTVTTPTINCSNPCTASQTHTTPVCNNNSTGGNAADDYFSFSVTGTVTDGSGNYVVKIGAWTSPSIVSGQAVSIVGNGLSGNPSLPANGSSITVRVEDAVTSTCFTTFTVSSAACSTCPTPNCGTVTVQKN